jgi:hypothetical protein
MIGRNGVPPPAPGHHVPPPPAQGYPHDQQRSPPQQQARGKSNILPVAAGFGAGILAGVVGDHLVHEAKNDIKEHEHRWGNG